MKRALLALLTAVLSLSACSGASLSSGAPKARCDRPGLAAYIAADESGSAQGKEITDERLDAIKTVLTQVATCDGQAKVVAFTNSAASTLTLFEGTLHPVGATDIGRARNVGQVVAKAMTQIQAAWAHAATQLPSDGTDVVAQLQLAAEYQRQLSADQTLAVTILTDGLSTTGVNLNTPTLTNASAKQLAQNIALPALPNTSVTFAGIGRVAGTDVPPSTFIDTLKTFYATTCERISNNCLVVTDLKEITK